MRRCWPRRKLWAARDSATRPVARGAGKGSCFPRMRPGGGAASSTLPRRDARGARGGPVPGQLGVGTLTARAGLEQESWGAPSSSRDGPEPCPGRSRGWVCCLIGNLGWWGERG